MGTRYNLLDEAITTCTHNISIQTSLVVRTAFQMFYFSGWRLYVPVNYVWIMSGHLSEPLHETVYAKTKAKISRTANCTGITHIWEELPLFYNVISSVLHKYLCAPRHENTHLFWFPTRRLSWGTLILLLRKKEEKTTTTKNNKQTNKHLQRFAW